MPETRAFRDGDWPAVWDILEPVFRAGDTYAVDPGISEDAAYEIWVAAPAATYVCHDGGEIVGTYYMKANHPGPGEHVCNCGYVVAPEARGRGIATIMCRHSQEEAVRLGFRAMQYNLVASTNIDAVRLWEKLGFQRAGRLPEAFRHPRHGDVDAFVMFKLLRQEDHQHRHQHAEHQQEGVGRPHEQPPEEGGP